MCITHQNRWTTQPKPCNFVLLRNRLLDFLRLVLDLVDDALSLTLNFTSLSVSFLLNIVPFGLSTLVVKVVPSVTLHQLRVEVNEMACEKKVVLRCHGHSISHECAGIQSQSCRELRGDAIKKSSQHVVLIEQCFPHLSSRNRHCATIVKEPYLTIQDFSVCPSQLLTEYQSSKPDPRNLLSHTVSHRSPRAISFFVAKAHLEHPRKHTC